jgi:hypothetical protein
MRMPEGPMTLQTFLDVTADVPEAMLRPAMVAALASEPARTPEAYRRFYDRVVRELSLGMPARLASVRNSLLDDASTLFAESTFLRG